MPIMLMKNVNRTLVGKSKGKRPLVIPRLREDNIKMNLRLIILEAADWIHLAQNRIR
jgi:hypothetical protein